MDTRQPAELDGYAIASLVVGVASVLFFLPLFLLGPVAMYLGHRGQARVRQSQGTLTGTGLAQAGRILGGLSFTVGPVLVAVVLATANWNS